MNDYIRSNLPRIAWQWAEAEWKRLMKLETERVSHIDSPHVCDEDCQDALEQADMEAHR